MFVPTHPVYFSALRVPIFFQLASFGEDRIFGQTILELTKSFLRHLRIGVEFKVSAVAKSRFVAQ